MSQENVELARAVFAAWNSLDMVGFRHALHPDVVMHSPEDWPEAGPFVGREAVMNQFHSMRDTFDADHIEAVGEFVDVGDRVVVRYRWHGAGRGPESSLEATCVITPRDGAILDVAFLWDHAEALALIR